SSADASAQEIGGNLHYLFPLGNPKITPYALGGLQLFRASYTATVLGQRFSESGSSFGLNLGGGLRWQAGRNWGVRPEIRFTIGDGTYTRGSVGVYYQFGK